jgi:hypothetical protein
MDVSKRTLLHSTRSVSPKAQTSANRRSCSRFSSQKPACGQTGDAHRADRRSVIGLQQLHFAVLKPEHLVQFMFRGRPLLYLQ